MGNREESAKFSPQKFHTDSIHVHLYTPGTEESNSTENSVKFIVLMHCRTILLSKVPYVTSVLVMQSCYASGVILESTLRKAKISVQLRPQS